MSELIEHQMTCSFIRENYPDVIFTFDGSGINQSKFSALANSYLRSSRGMPDLIILEPRGIYAGLVIEMKQTGYTLFKRDGLTYKNEHIEEQAGILDELQARGYQCHFCCGFEQARSSIERYMALPENYS